MGKTIFRVTLGQRRLGVQGWEQRCEGVEDLARVIETHRGVESWWSVHRWEGASRAARPVGEGDGWLGAQAVGLDFDVKGEGKRERAKLPSDTREAFYVALRGGMLPCSMGHATPRGVRVICVLDEEVGDRATWDTVAAEIARRCAATLAALPMPSGWGLELDERASLKVGFLWAPQASVPEVKDGPPVRRSDEVVVVRPAPWTLAELGVAAPESEKPAGATGTVRALVVAPTTAAAVRFDEARARYVADHPRDYPRGGSQPCPICCHEGGCCCWGAAKDRPGRWTCFSSSHSEGGVRGGSSWGGDVLDLDAHAAGLRGAGAPAEHLRATGYLGAQRVRQAGRMPSSAPVAPSSAVAVAPQLDPAPAPRPALRVVGPDERAPGMGAWDLPAGLRWPGSAWYVEPGGTTLMRESGRPRQDGSVPSVLVSHGPIYPAARARDVATGGVSLLLRWRGVSGWAELWVPRETALVSVELRRLAGRGLPVSSETAGELVRWIAAFEAANELPEELVTSAFGWVGRDPKRGFLLGRRFVGSPGAERVSFRAAGEGEEELEAALSPRGTIEGWIAGVGAVMARYPVALRALLSSLAAPLLSLLGEEGFTIDLSGGGSSTGKSTSMMGAMSVWGDPRALRTQWNQSRVSIERRLAAMGGGVPVWIDDTRQAKKAEDVSEMVMDVANGVGRGRGAVEGSRRTSRWRTIALSTGEVPASTMTTGGGERARLLCEEGLPFRDTSPATGELVRGLELAACQHHGTAGELWVRVLGEVDPEALRARHMQLLQELSTGARDGIELRRYRHAATLTLTAELAQAAGLLGENREGGGGSPRRPVEPEALARETAAEAPESRAWPILASWLAAERDRLTADAGGRLEAPARGWIGKIDKEQGRIYLLPGPVDEYLEKLRLRPAEVWRGAAARGWIEAQTGVKFRFRFFDASPRGYCLRMDHLEAHG